MKRPLFIVGTAYFTGTWLAFQTGENTALKFSAAALLTAALCFLLRDKGRYLYTACAVFLTAALAFAGFWLHIQRQVAPLRTLEGESAAIEGLIIETDSASGLISYTMKGRFTEHPDTPPDVIIVIRGAGEPEHMPGDTLRCRVSLSAAPDTLWYRSQGIALIGRGIRDAQAVPAGKYRLERTLIRLRNLMARNIYSRLPERSASIVAAFVLGMKSEIPPEVYTAMGRSGTVHLLSISGLHLSILAAFSLAALRKLRCPKRMSAAITILTAFLFTALVGFAASVFRAFVMTAAALSGRMISRRGDSLSSLGLALLICGVLRPHWALGWGLWLSATSTLGIIVFGDRVTSLFYESLRRGSRITDRVAKAAANAGGISVAAYAFTLPVLLLMSGWISLISPFANILVAPFVPVAVLGGIVCAAVPGAPPPIQAIVWLTDISVSIMIRTSMILAKLPFAIAAIDESWMLIWLAGLAVFAAILLAHHAGKGLLSYALALSMLVFSAGNLSLAAANRSRIELVTLSPYNAAVLLREGEAVILGSPDNYEISNLLKYLNFRGVRAIPAVIAADCGEQASSGLLRLAEAYNVDCVVGPDDAYVVSMLAEALPDSLVYAGGYAEVTVLGGAAIVIDMNGDIHVRAGKNQIVKTRAKYDIIDGVTQSQSGRIEIYGSGTMLTPKRTIPAFEPVGGYLFGESRILLTL